MQFIETTIPIADGGTMVVNAFVLGATNGVFAVQKLDRQDSDGLEPDALYVPLHIPSGAAMYQGAFLKAEAVSNAVLDFWMSLTQEQQRFLSDVKQEVRDPDLGAKYKQHIVRKMDVRFLEEPSPCQN